MFNVSVVSFESMPTPPSEKGWAGVGTLKISLSVLGVQIMIDGIKVKQKGDKYFFPMPSRKATDGTWCDVVSFPEEHAPQIREMITEAFKLYLSKHADQAWGPEPASLPLEPSYPDGYVALSRGQSEPIAKTSNPPSRPSTLFTEECPF